MNAQINENLIRDVVTEVLGRLSGGPGLKPLDLPAAPAPACGCGAKTGSVGSPNSRDCYGVFQDANSACEAARAAFLQLQQKGMAARVKIVEIVKALSDANAVAWGRLELDETKIGRLDHK